MPKDLWSQGIVGRASDDTVRAARTFRFWGAEVILLPLSGGIAATLAPETWPTAAQAWFAAGVAILYLCGFPIRV